jgi:hypothetical protein
MCEFCFYFVDRWTIIEDYAQGSAHYTVNQAPAPKSHLTLHNYPLLASLEAYLAHHVSTNMVRHI